MKKYAARIVLLALFFSFALPSYAADSVSAERTVARGNGFQITESAADHVVVRTFERTSEVPQIPRGEMEEILLTLGFVEEELNAMSEEDLRVCASSPKIQVSSAYYAVGTDGGAVPVTEAQAIQGAAAAEHAKGAGDSTAAYMYLYFTVIDLNDGDGSFRFGTTAQWLSMPAIRSQSAIGSDASLSTITPKTMKGFCSYQTETYTNGVLTSTRSHREELTEIRPVAGGAFYGGIFTLPADVSTPVVFCRTVGYTAHFQYDGKMNFPDQRANFNAAGTYAHTAVHFALGSPALSIDTRKTASAAVAVEFSLAPNYLEVPLEIEYIP